MRVEHTRRDCLRGVHRRTAAHADHEVRAERLRRVHAARDHLDRRVGHDLQELLRRDARRVQQLLQLGERARDARVAVRDDERALSKLRGLFAGLLQRPEAEHDLDGIVVGKVIHVIRSFFYYCFFARGHSAHGGAEGAL